MMKAVVLCEDHTLDQYIAKPVVEEIFREVGRAVRVQMATNPRIRGYQALLKRDLIEEVVARYRWSADAFFFLFDRDCDKPPRVGRVDALKQSLDLKGRQGFFCIAVQELEVWALALHRPALGADFESIRADCDAKENHFWPFVRQNNWEMEPGKGRKPAMSPLRERWQSLKGLCEEVRALSDDVHSWIATRP